MDLQLLQIARKKKLQERGLDDSLKLSNEHLIKNFGRIDTSGLSVLIDVMNDLLDEKKDRFLCKNLSNYLNMDINYELKRSVDTLPASALYRNKEWMKIILPNLEETECFVGVGLGHLMYKEGLIQKLRKEGYKLKPISTY